jgi:hypothetical protein
MAGARKARECTPGVESGLDRSLARARARARQQKRADVAGLFYGLLVRNGNGETALKNIHAL